MLHMHVNATQKVAHKNSTWNFTYWTST